MFVRKKKILYFLIPLFVSFISLFLYYKIEKNSLTCSYSDMGIWDLREASFANNVYNLKGPVEYIPNELLTPNEFYNRVENSVIKNITEEIGFSTRRIRLLLPNENTYVFSRFNNNFANRIYVNGEWINDIGSVGKDIKHYVPGIQKVIFTVKPENGMVEIIQQTSNFIDNISKEDTSWFVSNISNINKLPTNGYKDSMKIGSCFVLFVINITLFILSPKIKVNLYFSLFHLNYIIRSGLTGQQIFKDFLNNIPWIIQLKIEHITIPIRVILLVLIIKSLFPYILLKYERYLIYIVSIIYEFIFLIVDVNLIGKVLMICQISYMILISYTIFCFIIRRQKDIKLEKYIFLAGLVQLCVCMLIDFFIYKNTTEANYGEFTSFGTFIVIVLGAIAIIIDTINKMEEFNVNRKHLVNENRNLDKINRLKGKMIATITHEIKTPLTIISLYSQHILEDLSLKEISVQTRKDLITISDEAKRLANMASEMIEVTEKDDWKKYYEEVNLYTIIMKITRLCLPSIKKKKNILEIYLPSDLPKIYGNNNECSQIVWNILENAIRHTDKGKIIIKGEYNEEKVTVRITDTGEGISDKVLPYVFQRNVKGANGGSGLGLNICREIIEGHGGDININSKLGIGTEVEFSLPIIKK